MIALRSRSRVQFLWAVATTALWASVGFAPAAAASEPVEVGWWWAGHTSGSLLELQPVPDVPDGGLYVAGGLAGATGVSALRIRLDARAQPEILTLTVADAIGTPAVDLCAAATDWQPADGGPWDERPAPDCDTASVAGLVSHDGTTIAFDLAGFGAAQKLDAVLVPGASADTGAAANFSASFDPPDPDMISTDPPPTDAERQTPMTPPPRSEAMSSPSFTEPLGDVDIAGAPGPADSASVEPSPERVPLAPPVPRPINAAAPIDRFSYPAIVGLPLVLLTLGAYLGRSLTYPVTLASGTSQ